MRILIKITKIPIVEAVVHSRKKFSTVMIISESRNFKKKSSSYAHYLFILKV